MANGAKVLITEDAKFDLDAYRWDDHRFSDILIRENSMPLEEALTISRFIRQEISNLDLTTITLPMIEKLIESKLLEFGMDKMQPVRLDKSIFVRNGVNLTDNARQVLERRYLKKDADGQVIETPEEMFRRVARHIAKAEKRFDKKADLLANEDRFYRLMTEFKFLPNSPTLMNAGRRLGQLAACFVLPVDDSMDGIFDSLKNAALIHKSGGGTGFSFSRLRSKNSLVGSTQGVASGPVSFMRIFNTATEQVKQGGTRRGANMAILRIDHPDILEFIHCKDKEGELNNFNISVGITDTFMDAVTKDTDYELVDPRSKTTVGALNARQVYDDIVRQAWKTGDPGIVFLDRLNRDNPTPEIGEIESTNPCGEQPLLPMEACNLGSINLAKMVHDIGDGPAIDYDELKSVVWSAVRFLDNTIEMSQYPIEAIDQMVKGNRKIGLGVMGFADLLYLTGVAYNSDEALKAAEEIMGFIQRESHEASKALAEERGVFSNFNKSVFKNRKTARYRNATTTTIAPTGTLSIIAGCSSGIEPLFALSFVRNVMDNDKLLEVNPTFAIAARKNGFYTKDLMDRIAGSGSIQEMSEIPEDLRKIFVTAHDVTPEWHIRMQSAFQKYTDNAVSKTVNLPHDTTYGDVKKVYDLAYELGCKGVTIYRDGSKQNQVLSIKKQQANEAPVGAVKRRPDTLEGFTTRIKTGYGYLYVTVTEYDGRPFEVFATIGKSGRSTTAKTEAIGRLVSLSLRSGVEVGRIVDQLKGIGGEHPVFQEGGLVLSIPDAISRVLENRYLSKEAMDRKKQGNSLLGETCPECNQTISFEEGCMTCHFCGFTKCG